MQQQRVTTTIRKRPKDIVLKWDSRANAYMITTQQFKQLHVRQPPGMANQGIGIVAYQIGTNPMQVGYTKKPPSGLGVDDSQKIYQARSVVQSLEDKIDLEETLEEFLGVLSNTSVTEKDFFCSQYALPNFLILRRWREALMRNLEVFSENQCRTTLSLVAKNYLLQAIGSIALHIETVLLDLISSDEKLTKVPTIPGYPTYLVRKLLTSKSSLDISAPLDTFLFPKRETSSLKLTVNEYLDEDLLKSMGALARGANRVRLVLDVQRQILLERGVSETDTEYQRFLEQKFPLPPPYLEEALRCEYNFSLSRKGDKLSNEMNKVYSYINMLNISIGSGIDQTEFYKHRFLFEADENQPTPVRTQFLRHIRSLKEDARKLQLRGEEVPERLLNALKAYEHSYAQWCNVAAVRFAALFVGHNEFPRFLEVLTDYEEAKPEKVEHTIQCEWKLFDREVDPNKVNALRNNESIIRYVLNRKTKTRKFAAGNATSKAASVFLRRTQRDTDFKEIYPDLKNYLYSFNDPGAQTVATAALETYLERYRIDHSFDWIDQEDDESSGDDW